MLITFLIKKINEQFSSKINQMIKSCLLFFYRAILVYRTLIKRISQYEI